MKKLLVKLIIFTMILFTFTGCYTLCKFYFYAEIPLIKTSNILDYISLFYIFKSK